MRALPAARVELEARKVADFEAIFGAVGEGRRIEYRAPHPKHEFLTYLVERHPVLLHGSGDPAVEVFEPRWQTDYFGRFEKAVFACADGIWPMFFAIIDRAVYRGSIRNACYWDVDAAGQRRKYYSFSINAVMLPTKPWADGTIYILPRETFTPVRGENRRLSEEWLSHVPVRPLARLIVSPADFPYLQDVEGHGDEQWQRWEELAIELATAATAVVDEVGELALVYEGRDDPTRGAEELARLTAQLLPDLLVEVGSRAAAEKCVFIRGPESLRRKLAIAIQKWRAGL